MTITFVGHSRISQSEDLKKTIKATIAKSIAKVKTVTFYLGGYGDFDKICASTCRELKDERDGLELVYITPYITLSEQEKIKGLIRDGIYDTSLYPPIEDTPLRFAISKRNEWMVENSDLIIAYVKHTFGGAYASLKAAKRKGKRVINLFNL